MKIRFDFVTNSSSTSFSCYGIDIEETDFIKVYNKFHPESNVQPDNTYEYADELDQAIETFSNELGLECWWDSGLETIYFGEQWSDIKDNETGKEFKERIQGKVSLRFPDQKCYSITETIEN